MSFIHFVHYIPNNLHIEYISREWTLFIFPSYPILSLFLIASYKLIFWSIYKFISIQLIIQVIFTSLVFSISHSLCTLILWKNFRNGKMKPNTGSRNLLFVTLLIKLCKAIGKVTPGSKESPIKFPNQPSLHPKNSRYQFDLNRNTVNGAYTRHFLNKLHW